MRSDRSYANETKCKENECTNTFHSSRWGNQHAQNRGWFLQRNGDAWCPDHIPEWVAEWRAKQKAKKEK